MDISTVVAALFGAPKQNNRLLRLHTQLGPNALVAETLDGVESVDEGGYRLELTALSTNAHIDLSQLLDTPVLLQLLTAVGSGLASLHLRGLNDSGSVGNATMQDLTPRVFHGYITGIEGLGSNAGLARYRLVIEPWLSYLTQRTDSYVHQNQTVIDIVEAVFAAYDNTNTVQDGSNSMLAPDWRWDLADISIYRCRSITTQYNETDYQFVNRLLAEEGLFYWFEHEGDIASPTLGRHTMVIADHNGAFSPTDNPGPTIAYHRASATENEDTIQQWRQNRRLRTAAVAHTTWNYRARCLVPVTSSAALPDVIRPTDDDPAGAYAWHDRAEGTRRAVQHLDALNAGSDTCHAESSVRHLGPGQRFVLTEHADWPEFGTDGTPNNQFICLRLHHRARNNIDADVQSYVEQQLGKTQCAPALPLAFQSEPDIPGRKAPHDHQQTDHTSDADFYHNQFHAIAAPTPYRPATVNGHGQRRHPKPNVHGIQTAIVVGHGPIDTDRDYRVQIQYHWQRGDRSASGQKHPSGINNAPAKPPPTGAWVRILTALVGDNCGSVFVPRVGQEVLVDFIEGDIDRPVIIASLYNGQGNDDAPHNRVPHGGSKATGNAPAWFAGNAHPAVYSGIKTQAMSDGQTGTGGFNMLRFDDTPAQAKLQLATTQHHSGLHLGHLKTGKDNLRSDNRGYGIELCTEQSGAVRAGAGLLVTTETGTQQMCADTLHGMVNQSCQLTASLAATAQNQRTRLPKEPEPKQLGAARALTHTNDILGATDVGTQSAPGIGGGEGKAPKFSEPLLAISGLDGIGLFTPKTQVWVAGTQASLTAGKDISAIAQGNTTLAVAGGASLSTCGKTTNINRPVNQTGIKLHAATGQVILEATRGQADFNAEQQTTITSTDARVTASAKTRLVASATGAYLKLEGDNIELGAPGEVKFNAGQVVVTGPKAADPTSFVLSQGTLGDCDAQSRRTSETAAATIAVAVTE